MLDLTRLAELPAWLFPLGVLAASLVGSLHCAAMCGPICLGVSGGSRRVLGFYHLGRLLIYLVLGALAGAVGGVLLNEVRAPLVFIFAVGIGVLFLISGGSLLLRKSTNLGFVGRWLAGPLKWSQKFGPNARGVIAGLMSGALPCGWLYSFVLMSAATKSHFLAAATLFFFWLGTVPVLSGMHLVARKAGPRIWGERGLRWTFGVGFVVYGAFILHHRLSPLLDGDRVGAGAPVCLSPAHHIESSSGD